MKSCHIVIFLLHSCAFSFLCAAKLYNNKILKQQQNRHQYRLRAQKKTKRKSIIAYNKSIKSSGIIDIYYYRASNHAALFASYCIFCSWAICIWYICGVFGLWMVSILCRDSTRSRWLYIFDLSLRWIFPLISTFRLSVGGVWRVQNGKGEVKFTVSWRALLDICFCVLFWLTFCVSVSVCLLILLRFVVGCVKIVYSDRGELYFIYGHHGAQWGRLGLTSHRKGLV